MANRPLLQAIVTKYLCPTDRRGARIKAQAQAGSLTVSYDHEASNPHREAAQALADKMGWTWELVEAIMPDGRGSCFVMLAD